MALKVDKLQDIANQTIVSKKCYTNMFHMWHLEATNVQRLIQEVLVFCGQHGSQKHHLKKISLGGGVVQNIQVELYMIFSLDR